MNSKSQPRPRISINQETGCWEWLGCTQDNGYARVRISGKTEYVHRVFFRLFYGAIPSGLDVCHTCDNRKCCNPEHLFLGTREDNMRDAKAKGRLSTGNKHAITIAGQHGPRAKLTWDNVDHIRLRLSRGATPQSIADDYGVSVDAIRLIRRGATWKEELRPQYNAYRKVG